MTDDLKYDGVVTSTMGCNKIRLTRSQKRLDVLCSIRPLRRMWLRCVRQRKAYLLPRSALLVEGMYIGEMLLMGIRASEKEEPRSHLGSKATVKYC